MIFYKKDCGAVHNRKENFGCGTCSKYLAYSTENQVATLEYRHRSFYRKTIGVMLQNIDAGGGILSQISSRL